MKLKHQGGNKTDREKLAKTMVICFSNNKAYPDVPINLPPGVLLEEARKLNMELSSDQARELQEICSLKFNEYANKI